MAELNEGGTRTVHIKKAFALYGYSKLSEP